MTFVDSYDSDLVYDTDEPFDPFLAPVSAADNTPVTHLALPLVILGDGTFNSVIQNTIAEVAQCVEVICGSVQGERTVVPSFGMPMQDFQIPSATAYLQAINKWEPRAVANVQVTAAAGGVANVDVSVSLARGNPG